MQSKVWDKEVVKAAIEKEKPVKVIAFCQEAREQHEVVIYENGAYTQVFADSGNTGSTTATNGTPMIALVFENGTEKILSAEKPVDPEVNARLKRKLARVQTILEGYDKEAFIVGKDGKRIDLNKNPFLKIVVYAGIKALAEELKRNIR